MKYHEEPGVPYVGMSNLDKVPGCLTCVAFFCFWAQGPSGKGDEWKEKIDKYMNIP